MDYVIKILINKFDEYFTKEKNNKSTISGIA